MAHEQVTAAARRQRGAPWEGIVTSVLLSELALLGYWTVRSWIARTGDDSDPSGPLALLTAVECALIVGLGAFGIGLARRGLSSGIVVLVWAVVIGLPGVLFWGFISLALWS